MVNPSLYTVLLLFARYVREPSHAGYYYSARLPSKAVEALFARAAPSALTQGGRLALNQQSLLAAAEVRGVACFSVTRARPHSLHRALPGGLHATDVGISLHKILLMNPDDHTIRVDVTPFTFKSSVVQELGSACLALLLSPCVLPLHTLLRIKAWQSEPNVKFLLVANDIALGEHSQLAQELLHVLTASTTGLALASVSTDTRTAAEELLHVWHAEDLVHEESDVWTLTEKGLESVSAGIKLHRLHDVLEPAISPDSKLHELSLFQLLLYLEGRGWHCETCDTKAAVKQRRKQPYTVAGGDKTWYVRNNQTCDATLLLYVRALALAPQHRLDVPHFAKADTYNTILGLTKSKKKTIAQRRVKNTDEWASDVEFDTQPRKRPRAKPKGKPVQPRSDSNGSSADAGPNTV
eukprot:6492704-Amphidinium_carterae.1